MLNLERRCTSRITLQADATLTLDGDAWTGTVRNISLDGLYMVVPDTVPVSDHQLLQLALVSEIGILELKGSLASIREVSRQPTDQADTPPLGLAVKFAPLGAIEREILGSLLDELRERAVSIRLTGLLIPRETGDLLLEVNTQGSGTTAFTPMTSSTPETEEAAPTDRRLTSRGTVSIPVLIRRTCGPAAGSDCLSAQTIDISLGGISLRVMAPPTSLENPVVLQLALPPSPAGRTAQAASPESSLPNVGIASSDCILTAELVWTAPGSGDGGERGPNDRPDTFQLGLRFPHLDDDPRLRIAGLVAGLLTAKGPAGQGPEADNVVSELLELQTHLGRRLAFYHDCLGHALPEGTPLVIISPGYGESKKEQIALAYYFAANGFRVLRYDYTNHVGESEGDIQQSTLSGMKQDLTAMLDFAERTWPASPVTVVASSLAGRVALKAVAGDRRVSLLVLLNAVVDVRATLVAVHQEDHMGMYLNGAARGMMNVLGFNINADHWLEDAIAEGYADLHTTVKDAEQIRTPVVIFAAENDAWISKDSLRTVHAALCSTVKPLYFIPEALHSLHENPRKARAVFRQLVACCREQFFTAPTPADIRQPAQRVIGLQSRLERDRARAQRQMGQAELVEFWRDYLDHFHYVVNVHDYWQLLDHIYRLTAVPNKDTLIFDAGCGNGNFGVFLMVNQAYSQRHTSAFLPTTLKYVGGDFIFNALTQARGNFRKASNEFGGQAVSALGLPAAISPALALLNLNRRLPFQDDQFDRIVCNLVIAYVDDPLFTLREMMRILSPGGKLVLTNLKPRPDLSQIYRNFVQVAERAEEVEEARQLLQNSGKIIRAESDGVFRFFDRQELMQLLIASGAGHPRIYSTFANQAYITVAEKNGAVYAASTGPGQSAFEPRVHT